MKFRKQKEQQCYCNEEIILNKMDYFPSLKPQCIFCYNKTKEAMEYDVDSANDRIIKLRKDSIRRY